MRPLLSRIASVSALVFVAACGGGQPSQEAPRLTSAEHAKPAAVLAPKIVNGTGRPDADVAPIVRAALERRVASAPDATLSLVPVLEPATALGADLAVAVKLEVRKGGEVVGTIRKTVAKPGAKVGDRAAEDELYARAVEDAAADFASHAESFGK
jgi:hypothetical protein